MTDKRIRIILDSKGAKRNADELNNSVRDIGSSAEKSQFSVNKLAAAIAAVISTQKIAQFADAFTRVQNQLTRTVTSTEELAAATQQLLDVANQTRAGIEPTVELYTALTVSTKDLAISQGELVGVTKTINNLFLESGKGAAETAGAIRQLGQALESGALRGDEFNSVAEGAPGILRAIQQETGLTRAELRQLAEQGQITAELIVRSLQNYSDEAQRAADKTQVTLAQAFTVADNNLTNFIGQLDDATGASSSLANAIIDLTNYIGSPEFINGLLRAFNTSRLAINATTDSVGDFSSEILFAKDVGVEAAGLIGNAFRDIVPNIRSLIQVLTIELVSTFEKINAAAKTGLQFLLTPFSVDNIKQLGKQTRDEIAAIDQVRKDSLQSVFDERQAILSTAEAASQARIKEVEERKKLREESSGGLGLIEGSGVAPKKGNAVAVDNGEREIASAQSVTRSLEQELALRRQVAEIYRSNELGADASFYEQQLAQIQIREAEERAIAQAKYSEETAQREERLAATLENDRLTQEARRALQDEFTEQNKIAAEILEQELTAIRENGRKSREEIDRVESENRIKMAFDMASSGIALLQAFGSKSSKTQKQLARVSIGVDTAQGVAAGVKLGWPAGIPAVAWAIANGKNALDRLNSAGGGGGGAVSAPSMSSGIGQASIPTTASAQPVQQKQVIELRGATGSDTLRVDQVKELMERDGAVVIITDAIKDASRRNVVGVTGR